MHETPYLYFLTIHPHHPNDPANALSELGCQASEEEMPIAELKLTDDQHRWIEGWLELWGAWVYSGRLEKRQSSIIAQFMERVEPGRMMSRPMCNDDDGMLISQVVDSVMCIDPEAYKILLSYYANCSSQYSIAVYMHKVATPRKMGTRGGNRVINPSLSFFRRIVKEKLEASQYFLYEPLRITMNNRKCVAKICKVA